MIDSAKDSDISLFPPQKEVVERGLLSSGFSSILQLPTGSGKTWLAAQTIRQVLEQGQRAVYLAPLRALAEELTEEWESQFSEFKVGIFTGDYGGSGQKYPVPFKEADLLIMTPERLDACTRAWRQHWNWLPKVDLVVVDEIHLLNDERRGPRLEGAISRTRRLNPFIRFLGLSATIGNRQELAEWLKGTSYRSSWRPIPLDWKFSEFNDPKEKSDLLLDEARRNVDNGGQTLVFVQSRRRAEELATFLEDEGLVSSHHHAGLIRKDRERIENKFRSGDLDVLVATSTLEMGVNLPVRQVVLYDIQRFNGIDFEPLSTNSVWQRVGRAGRPGLDSKGEAVLIMPSWDRKSHRYPDNSFDPINSQLSNSQALAEQIVTEVASGLSTTPDQLESNMDLYLAGHQKRLSSLEEVYNTMVEAGMIEEESKRKNGKLRLRLSATKLGWVAVRHMLRPETVLLCRRVIKHHRDLSFFDILLTACSTSDITPVLPVDFEELDLLSARLEAEPSFLLNSNWEKVPDLLEVEGKRLLSGIKMALVLRAWTRTGDIKKVAERFDCYPFEVTQLRDSTSRLLTAWPSLINSPEEDVPTWVHDGVAPLDERVRAIGRMVESGLNESVATLTLISGIGSTFAGRLSSHGVNDIEELASADLSSLCAIKGVSEKRAQEWVWEAAETVADKSAFWFKDVGPNIEVESHSWPASVDPYRLRRALDLDVQKPSTNSFLVSGGLEPHKVQDEGDSLSCDCADAAKGNLCKHVLAIRLRTGDSQLQHLADRLTESKKQDISLFDLWYDYSAR